MIIYEKLTGFQNSHYVLRYVTPWTTIFQENAVMRFLKENINRLVDVTVDDGPTQALKIATYPHNRGLKLEEVIEKYEDKIRYLIQTEKALGTDQELFTLVVLVDDVRLLRKEDFENYYPATVSGNEAFIFQGEGDVGFPTVYFIDGNQRTGLQHSWLEVYARSSHMALKPSGKQTAFGKRFTYMFLSSVVNGKFNPKIPDLLNMSMPSSPTEEIPSHLNMKTFTDLIESGRVRKLIMQNGKEVVEAEVIETESEKTDKEEARDSFPNPLMNLEENIVDAVMNGIPINLTDIFNYGLSELIRLIGNLDKVVEVQPDMPNIAKRMCLFQGKLHMIPYAKDFEPDDFFGDPIEFFVLCDETNYPR